MNKSRYKEITNESSSLPISGCRTIVCLWMQPMATTGNSNSEYTIIRFMRDGEMLLFTTVSLRLKKTKRPLFFTHQLLIVACINVKKTENADLKSGDADIVNN